MAVNETIVTGRKFRKLIDAANKQWQRISFWHKASDCEFDDGKTAQTKVGAIDGITSDLSGESETVAASIKCVNQLNSSLGSLSGLVKIVTVTGTTSSAGNLNLQLDLSVKVISAICRDNTNYSCKLHVNTDKTSWMAYVHDYTNNTAISNRNVTVDVYYIE